ncbi:steroid 17-alpha-hydroxylase/17,20 lyase-like [Clytia hemisphaerica]
MIETILLAIPGFVLLWVLITYVEHLISLRKYPKGPFPLPLVGNVLLLSEKPYLDFIKLTKTYGDVFSFSFGMKRIVIVNSYEGTKEALITRGTDFAGRPTDSIYLKIHSNDFSSVAWSDYTKSNIFIRKLATKSLHLYGTGMANIEEIIIEGVEKMCSILSKETNKPVTMKTYLGNTIVNTICHLCFSKRYEPDDAEFQRILRFTNLLAHGLNPAQPLALFPWLRFFPDTDCFRSLKLGCKIRHELTNRFFNEHIKTFNPEKIRDVADNLLYLSQNKDVWQDAGFEEVTQQQLESITHDIFTAGIETNLTTLRWFIIYILKHPEVQTNIYQEIVSKIGLKRQPVVADMEKLDYVQAVLHETNRFASIAPLNVPHKTIVDTTVRNHQIPKDTQVLFNLYSMHHDPTHWNEPEKFKPERWLNADGSLKKEKATHYIPFSAGTRVCLGKRMAEMQLFLIVTRLLVNFEVSLAAGESVPDINHVKVGLTLEPASDPDVMLTRR